MFTLLSPAKKLNENAKKPQAYLDTELTTPNHLDASCELMEVLRSYSVMAVKKLMGLSQNLAELNQQRFQDWQANHEVARFDPAILLFNGDVYNGLQAASFSSSDIVFAQQHIGILSGLYGLLRPLDRIQPYRLEMGTSLQTARGTDLYSFWRDELTQAINLHLIKLDKNSQQPSLLLNLASQEYFQVLNRQSINARIITPVFKDLSKGSYKIISFYAKKARGLMARYIVQNRINQAIDLESFNLEGYWFNREASDQSNLVFYRDHT